MRGRPSIFSSLQRSADTSKRVVFCSQAPADLVPVPRAPSERYFLFRVGGGASTSLETLPAIHGK